jgi:hypothetical protein
MKKLTEEQLKTKIVSALNKGTDTHTIADRYKVSWQKVAAYKAHITMGNI